MAILRPASLFATALAVAVLSLSACSAPGAQEGANAPSSAQSPTASRTPSPTPTPAVYSDRAIQAALTKVKADQGITGQVIGQADFAKIIPQAKEAMKLLDVQPPACARVFQTDMSKVVSEANLGMLASDRSNSSRSLTVHVVSFPSVEALERLLPVDASVASICSDVTMRIGGFSAHASVKLVEVSVPGAKAMGSVGIVDSAGTAQTTLSVTAVKGSTEVTVNLAAPGADSPSSVDKVTALVSSTFAALDSQGAPA
ncbi:hypothetical protein [Sinomonas sp. ASV322]|uniref:hypothetical protein n=1 Tax=Sinomonas sp. ASV322 TaxID=3041920 RepID=UPI0027DC39E3|nr:hypothetical protein [Sinomonas sp. ASV322]MDQ4502729.1 hypothetical protein [Sinomonas sp. ASV322]